ncbi:MAG: hypothetical protein EBR72_08070 [Bacteroidetes bacterium]|jgi:hypothetical protein|nr:hypothetical protein [Bacteroidota bacterium]
MTTESKKVKVELDILSAATARQILFEAQKGYSYEFPPQRINVIRDVIKLFDEKIEGVVNE